MGHPEIIQIIATVLQLSKNSIPHPSIGGNI
jgi:hypothetical protein